MPLVDREVKNVPESERHMPGPAPATDSNSNFGQVHKGDCVSELLGMAFCGIAVVGTIIGIIVNM